MTKIPKRSVEIGVNLDSRDKNQSEVHALAAEQTMLQIWHERQTLL